TTTSFAIPMVVRVVRARLDTPRTHRTETNRVLQQKRDAHWKQAAPCTHVGGNNENSMSSFEGRPPSIAYIMLWAADRKATRVDDQAYSLLQDCLE
ncbi:hypothetical protein BKA82DRAFT_1005846, partial [Pisolithus tinctorius]